ncbi:MAG: sodium:proton antiporter [Lachnospiraceae bacterium]|nr:sodium:proton antiporter [Lachnospiraceae bacterium]
MALTVILLFCGGLILCLALGQSVLYALAFGFLLFCLYGRRKGIPWRELFRLAGNGIWRVRNILISFVLIGMLTAVWRAGGTIPAVITYASALISPKVFLLMTFLLNSLVSVLTGSAFGTAATIGVICSAMAAPLGIPLWLVGGAVLSGVFVGDRCSPVSTSALLVAELTGTNLFENIRRMLRSALVPFLAACAAYAAAGFLLPGNGPAADIRGLFTGEFRISPLALIPAGVIVLLSLLKVDVKWTLSAGVISAVPLCLLLQKTEVSALLRMLWSGYRAADPVLAGMLDGGGITSMLGTAGIVLISAAYSDILRRTGLLDGTVGLVERLASRTGRYPAMLLTSFVTAMIACSQTLAVMLTNQLCAGLKDSKEAFALDMEDSVIIAAPLVPWCIAGSVPLTTVGAPLTGILAACYLYFLILWRLLRSRK